jgi:hypothetical protein
VRDGLAKTEEMMLKAGILLPPDEEEERRVEWLLSTQGFDEWKEESDRELREKGDLQ